MWEGGLDFAGGFQGKRLNLRVRTGRNFRGLRSLNIYVDLENCVPFEPANSGAFPGNPLQNLTPPPTPTPPAFPVIKSFQARKQRGGPLAFYPTPPKSLTSTSRPNPNFLPQRPPLAPRLPPNPPRPGTALPTGPRPEPRNPSGTPPRRLKLLNCSSRACLA